ncbi:GNAT family N-acetyltransferase [Campylobacter taeniopygiae]|uniref:GNAT family N-acetyltransferase n=1 Tax=Campylobacter taeniopygiae TaxID=2510188 RepID=A0ABY2TJG1_9BACT|nr:GNAT family N-acetyltransferase [Campylobacter taeniopygiae]TKX34003.1 GNAT family N-acetyltransferase [Campylobacter taeniopygiae]
MIRHYKELSKTQIEKLLGLWEESVKASHDFLDEKNFKIIKKYLMEFDFKGLEFLFAYEKDELAGFLGFHQEEIQMLFIHPSFFNRGFGSQLLKKAMQDFKLNKVEVNFDNKKALKFYQKFGFQIVGEYQDDFGFKLLKMQKS